MLSIGRQFATRLPKKQANSVLKIQTRLFPHRSLTTTETSDTKALSNKKVKQALHNILADIIPGFEKVEPRQSQNTVILSEFEGFLIKNNPVQIPNGCLIKAIQVIDGYNKKSSVFDDPIIRDVLSGKTPLSKATFSNFEAKVFLKNHLMPSSLTEDQENGTVSEKTFITDTIGHSVLTDIYMSSQNLAEHLTKTNQPIYTMLTWGESQYKSHAIIVFGIDVQDNIYFWDVSDRLPVGEKRIRKMHIEDFNSRRSISIEETGFMSSHYRRSQIYFYKKES